MIRKLVLLLLFSLFVLEAYNPEVIIARIEQLMESKKDKLTWNLRGIYDKECNLWLTWVESDILTRSTHCYIQKFNSIGTPFFTPVEVMKHDYPPGDELGFSNIFLGYLGDIYAFPGWNFSIIRVDNKGNLYKSERIYSHSVYFGDMFIDSSGIMHIFSEIHGRVDRYTKLKVQNPLPVLLEEKAFSIWDSIKRQKKPEYRWVRNSLKFCDPKKKYTLFVQLSNIFFGPPYIRHEPWTETTRVYLSKMGWSDFKFIDTFSFQIKDALHKKIKGCRLKLKESIVEQGVLLEGNGDTLLLYLPSRDTIEEIVDLVYLCKIKKDGTPIKAMEVKEEEVKDFSTAPENLQLEIAIWGREFGKPHQRRRTIPHDSSFGPNGMMIYGFDKSGNMYYYVWDKSDDYWKKK
ncbi:MAG: hypothetical protein ACFE8N_14425 [Promethearchaeota archaeon]